MSHSRTGWYFPDDALDTTKAAPSLFAGLPMGIVEKIGDDPTIGNAGILSYFNHFLQWEGPLTEASAGGWTLSGVTGTATITQPDVRSGEIAITADGTANCDPTLQLGGSAAPSPFIYAVGKRIWVAARLKMATVASTEFLFGIATPDTEPTTTNTFPSDGIFFHKASAATQLSFDVRKDGTSTSKATITAALVNATYTTIGFFIDKLGHIRPYQDGAYLPAGLVAAGTANIPVTADIMQLMIGFRGASQIVTLDWLLAAQDI